MNDIFKDEVYQKMQDAAKKKTDSVNRRINALRKEWTDPVNDEAEKINSFLVQVCKDSRLHKIVKENNVTLEFGHYKKKVWGYNGYSHMILSPDKGMSVVTIEPNFMADSGGETHEYCSAVMLCEDKLYAMKESTFSEKEHYLIANAVLGEELFTSNFSREGVPTAEEIKDSLEEAIKKFTEE